MHTIPASEIKRRGVAALDEALKSGPVHIIKNNRPQYVVISEEGYLALTKLATPSVMTVVEHIQEKSAISSSAREEIHACLAKQDSLSSQTITLGVAEGRYSIPEPDAYEDAEVAALFETGRIFPSADEKN